MRTRSEAPEHPAPRDPAQPHESGARDRSVRIAVPLLLGALAAAVTWFRLPWITRNTLWAEDGRIFLEGHFAAGLGATFDVYEGYLHVIPRLLVTAVASTLPPPLWAAGIAAACCLAVGALAALVHVCAVTVVPQRWVAAALALAPAVVPLAPLEVAGNAANLHWYLIWACLWAVVARFRSRSAVALLTVFALAAALTEIQLLAIVVVGAALQVLPAFRWKGAWPVLAALAVGVAAQIAATVLSPRTPNLNEKVLPLEIVQGYAVNALMTLYRGYGRSIGHAINEHGWLLPAAMALPLVAAVAYLLVRGTARERALALVLPALSVGLWTVAVWANPYPGFYYTRFGPQQFLEIIPSRYGFVPSLLLLALLVLTIGRLCREKLGGRIAAGLLAAGLLTIVIWNAHLPYTYRSAGPVWPDSVQAARQECAGGEGAVEITTAPWWGWSVTVPCGELIR